MIIAVIRDIDLLPGASSASSSAGVALSPLQLSFSLSKAASEKEVPLDHSIHFLPDKLCDGKKRCFFLDILLLVIDILNITSLKVRD
jgi:hypothetical protein